MLMISKLWPICGAADEAHQAETPQLRIFRVAARARSIHSPVFAIVYTTREEELELDAMRSCSWAARIPLGRIPLPNLKVQAQF